MTPRDFIYWLQGLFELAEPKTLTARQTTVIEYHLKLVFIWLRANTSPGGVSAGEGFATWMRGYLEAIMVTQASAELTEASVDKIRQELANIFEHVIDPLVGKDIPHMSAADLQAVHDTGKLPEGKPPQVAGKPSFHNSLEQTYRC